MELTLNYIYDEKGIAEYVVVPIKYWERVKQFVKIEKTKPAEKPAPFDPREFYGIISHYNLDIDDELKNMRDEWTRNF